jgi:gamma-glutamyltranspeptidase/glutathione hydrolase
VKKAIVLSIGLGACAVAPPRPSAGPDVGKRVVAEHGVVASGNPYASDAGLEILKQGGNAVDAAVAVAFALGVTEPMMSGLGAGGGLLYYDARAHHPEYVDFYSQTGAEPDRGLHTLGNNSATARGVGVPGAVAGLLGAQAKWGKLSRAAVMAPAIRLATNGYTANSLLERELATSSAKVAQFEGARNIFLPHGQPLHAGDHVVQPELAATLRAIADGGQDAFYKGRIAGDIVRTLREGGSTMTENDFAAYTARYKRPLCTTYHGRVVLSAPAPQSGMEVLETLNLLDSRSLPSIGLPSRSPEAFRVLTNAMRVSVTDRDAFVGDPDRVGVPQAGVASKKFAASRASVLDSTVHGRLAPGNAWSDDHDAPAPGCDAMQPTAPSPIARVSSLGTPGDGEMAETTHITVIDDAGNAVSLTNTLGLGFGTGTWVDGVFFNSAMFNFARNDSGPNAIGPQRVPASTIAPTVVLNHGAVEMVVGCPGSAAIPPGIVSAIVYGLDYKMDPLQSLRMPRMIPTPGAQLRMEDGFASEVYAEARKLGYVVQTSPPVDMGFGGVTVITRIDGRWVGAADPRRDGEVRGY